MPTGDPRPIMKFSEEWWAKYAHPENRCVAHRRNGNQCRHPARRGTTVCRVHGGAVPQVINRARERISLAADRMARELLGVATNADSEAVKLSAVKDALDRAGLAAKTDVTVEVKPWESVLADLSGVAQISRAESQFRRGILPPPALAESAMEVVDAEVVDAPADAPADPEPPTPSGLAPYEAALANARRRRTPLTGPDAPAAGRSPRSGTNG